MIERSGTGTRGDTRSGAGWWRMFHDKFVVEERYVDPGARKRLYRTAVALMVLGAVLFGAALAVVMQSGTGPTSADEAARTWLLLSLIHI